jgi:hypothetical protein
MMYNILLKASQHWDHTMGLPFDAEVVTLKLQHCDIIFWPGLGTTTSDSEVANGATV